MKRTVLIAVACVATLAVVGAIAIVQSRNKGRAELDAALQTARSAGLPTGGAEFRRSLATPQGKNAFEVIQEFKRISEARQEAGRPRPLTTNPDLLGRPKNLQEFGDYLAVFDEAASCDEYVPMREWEQGLMVFFEDFAELKYVARLAIARARASIAKGDIGAALEDASKVAKIAAFVRSERHEIAVLVAEALDVMVATLLLEATTAFKSEAQWQQAQAVFDGLSPSVQVRDRMSGDMAMFLDTLRFMFKGDRIAQEFLSAVRSDAGVSTAKRVSDATARTILAEATTVWTEFFRDASDDPMEFATSDAAYDKIYTKLAEWTLVHGLPVEMAKVMETLSISSRFELLYESSLRAQMRRLAFGLARSRKFPENGGEVEGTFGFAYTFRRTANGFSLECARPGRTPMVVYCPKKP
jgi:hypothetical protein